MGVIKKFAEWLGLKERLHNIFRRPPVFKEGELWWCSIGENIGSEINGKSKKFSRPVVVFKKLSGGTFLGVPTTSLNKIGSWYVQVVVHDITETAILSQVRVLDYKRLHEKIGQLDASDFKKLKVGFRKLYVE